MAFLQEFISKYQDLVEPLQYLNRFEAIIISPFETNANLSDDRHTSFKIVSMTMPDKNLRTVTNENIYGPNI